MGTIEINRPVILSFFNNLFLLDDILGCIIRHCSLQNFQCCWTATATLTYPEGYTHMFPDSSFKYQ